MRGKDVTLERVSITYPNGFTAVQPTDLQIGAGEFFSILGPSGCGKTTILRAVSGFVSPSTGRILIGGEDQAGRAPNARPTALIFQNLALFPLMSVRDNVAFGLEARGMGKRERHGRAEELLALVALQDQADKTPPELSGGQRQRVAIARALAVEPAVLLLDEPLSALDLKLRSHMRAELRAIQKKTGVTFIYITHDQGEALTMSDRIAVMNAGRVEQVGTADEVYSTPATAFAASFVGESNILKGRIAQLQESEAQIQTALGTFRARNPQRLAEGAAAYLFVRPEAMRLGGPGNTISGQLVRRDLEGPFVNLFFAAAGHELVVHQTNTGPLPSQPGEAAVLGFAPADALILPEGPLAATGQELAAE
ncbi:ABC transporter ATP-binding protein [Rhodovulum adriaticum]|uniref:Spermidine/putrescine transport system ATP-binding protein n=1 Tax=Rhodovulum adriaticum TaxID=35804 RepID=A0A4R2NML6_RHOAD|nr:ABC transporter ATP-binding protein [Rhodovulum adriaticum]MBK1635757.1 ABC transporter ATP-binding protein [Rhodovulum adriaticum]TCP22494.1 spermidine/putrescine transport system ATP-binding protein [Rhodovulum adriaticum]